MDSHPEAERDGEEPSLGEIVPSVEISDSPARWATLESQVMEPVLHTDVVTFDGELLPEELTQTARTVGQLAFHQGA